MMLLNDYLRAKIKDAGFAEVEISKTPTGSRIVLHVTRPGIVIGRKGSGIRELTEVLTSQFGLKNPQISVVEIQKPELSPSVMCNRLASHIERGTAFRRATMWTLQQIMEGGAMGVQITVSGKLRGDRSAFEKHFCFGLTLIYSFVARLSGIFILNCGSCILLYFFSCFFCLNSNSGTNFSFLAILTLIPIRPIGVFT